MNQPQTLSEPMRNTAEFRRMAASWAFRPSWMGASYCGISGQADPYPDATSSKQIEDLALFTTSAAREIGNMAWAKAAAMLCQSLTVIAAPGESIFDDQGHFHASFEITLQDPASGVIVTEQVLPSYFAPALGDSGARQALVEPFLNLLQSCASACGLSSSDGILLYPTTLSQP